MSEALAKFILSIAQLARTDAFASRLADGRYSTMQGEFSLHHAKAQLEGGAAYGVYPVVGDQTRIAVIDLDDHEKNFPREKMLEVGLRIREALLDFDQYPIMFQSGGGFGIHIWLLFANRQKARVVRVQLRKVLAKLGLKEGTKGVADGEGEIFPKQDGVTGAGLGNLIALPFARESGWINPATGSVLKRPEFVGNFENWLGPDLPDDGRVEVSARRVKKSEPSESEFEDVRSALKNIQADDFTIWIKVMLALKHRFADKGFELWLEWSKSSPSKFKGDDDCRKRWDEAKPNGQLGLGSIFRWAKEGGWNGPANSMNRIIAELNERFGILTHGNKTLIIIKDASGHDDDGVVLLGLGPFLDRMAPETIALADSSGGTKQASIAPLWKQHANAAHYYKLVFDPALPSGHNGKTWNTYTGLAFDPLPGEWGKFRNHLLEVVCDGRQDLFDWFLNWMALGVQKPADLIGTAPVLKGPPGTGKSVVAEIYGKLWGRHYISVTQAAHVLGRFNAHLASRRLVFIDEGMFGGNRKEAGVIKTRVTEKYVVMEQKGVDPIRMKNFTLIIMASNEDSVVPADSGDRRWMVLEVNKSHKEDRAYFSAIFSEMENGGYEAMLYDLLHRDVSQGPDPRLTIKTEALFDEVLRAQPAYVQYIHMILHQGRLPQNLVAGPRCTTIRALLEDMRLRFPTEKRISDVALGRHLKKIIPAITSDKNGKYLVRYVGKAAPQFETSMQHELPELADARHAFVAYVGVIVPWPEENDDWLLDPEVEFDNEEQGNQAKARDPRFDAI